MVHRNRVECTSMNWHVWFVGLSLIVFNLDWAMDHHHNHHDQWKSVIQSENDNEVFQLKEFMTNDRN